MDRINEKKVKKGFINRVRNSRCLLYQSQLLSITRSFLDNLDRYSSISVFIYMCNIWTKLGPRCVRRLVISQGLKQNKTSTWRRQPWTWGWKSQHPQTSTLWIPLKTQDDTEQNLAGQDRSPWWGGKHIPTTKCNFYKTALLVRPLLDQGRGEEGKGSRGGSKARGQREEEGGRGEHEGYRTGRMEWWVFTVKETPPFQRVLHQQSAFPQHNLSLWCHCGCRVVPPCQDKRMQNIYCTLRPLLSHNKVVVHTPVPCFNTQGNTRQSSAKGYLLLARPRDKMVEVH